MATPSEANFDMGAIETTYGLGDYNPDIENEYPEYHDNMMTEYLKSQGYTDKDLIDAIANGTDDNFLKAVVEECLNTYGMCGLTVLAKMDIDTYHKLMKLKANNQGSITINASATDSFGLFDPWNGSGSLLELPIKNSMTVPTSNIHNIQVEGSDDNGYTVDEVYGLTGDAWNKDAVTVNAE